MDFFGSTYYGVANPIRDTLKSTYSEPTNPPDLQELIEIGTYFKQSLVCLRIINLQFQLRLKTSHFLKLSRSSTWISDLWMVTHTDLMINWRRCARNPWQNLWVICFQNIFISLSILFLMKFRTNWHVQGSSYRIDEIRLVVWWL